MSDSIVLEMVGIDKVFPGVKALEQVSFQLIEGEIHGLLGENGAGKSTLMKVLAGIYSHDAGDILVHGQKQKKLNPKQVEKLGIYFIHQERYVVPTLTVAETLFLGKEKLYTSFGIMKRKIMEKQAEKFIKETVDVSIACNRLISELTVGEQQLIQICRAIIQQPKVLVFDEPTAVLAKQEKEKLFEIIRQLQKRSISIVYISHYFGEILEICDRITVLRDGKKVKTASTTNMTIEDMVYTITGKQLEEKKFEKDWQAGATLLEVKNLTKKHSFQDVSFKLKKGEIVGITGLMGSGYAEVGTAIFDSKDVIGGTITFEGNELSRLSPERSVALGIGYVPEDRRNHGIIKKMTVKQNTTLASLKSVSKSGLIQSKKESTKVQELIEKLDVRTPNLEEEIEFLSGGNQQKVVLAKWLHSGSKLFILNQPTAAVDVGAKAEIYQLIIELAKQGAGILLISQDLKELERLSDTVYVMYRGKIIDEIPGEKLTSDQLMLSMMGGNTVGTVNHG
ncbi:sugar ABC transporter ATP-binding protein [Bacillus sp. Marseille-P3661]|uniref:sugar ABC transporter ATP-binding protein n=1 Tax=Bacillus sp. Marseille-P3661 TaxID=1936234 RepID=UPI000C843C21|nr:sugar ABC transporter ATP-binding protein [Bacillus sp. Marseille-P3661]